LGKPGQTHIISKVTPFFHRAIAVTLTSPQNYFSIVQYLTKQSYQRATAGSYCSRCNDNVSATIAATSAAASAAVGAAVTAATAAFVSAAAVAAVMAAAAAAVMAAAVAAATTTILPHFG
jgi:hypothetical protein